MGAGRLILEPRTGEYDIERHAAGAMKKRKDSRARHEIRIADNHVETVAAQRMNRIIKRGRFDIRRDTDIGAQTGTSPDDRRLSAEEIPPQPL